jgi:hypothetical protein
MVHCKYEIVKEQAPYGAKKVSLLGLSGSTKIFMLVEVSGFEPLTTWLQTRRSPS